MSKCVVIFGPAGAGKSTCIEVLRKRGFAALDLELLPPALRSWMARQAGDDECPLSSLDYIGAADVGVQHFPPLLYHRVLLLPSRGEIALRRRERAARLPFKIVQVDHYDGFAKTAARYDEVVDRIVDRDGVAIGPAMRAVQPQSHTVTGDV